MIISSKDELWRIINSDCRIYLGQSKKKLFIKKLIGHSDVSMCKFLEYMRKEQFYKEKNDPLSKVKYLFYMGRKHKYGMRLGIEMQGECVGEGVTIRHFGCITVNSFARIGNNCTLRGDNCIGVAHDGGGAPRIGNNVDIGFGAKILGDIQIADDCVIGANAVVIHSCDEKGAVLVGVPARVVRNKSIR